MDAHPKSRKLQHTCEQKTEKERERYDNEEERVLLHEGGGWMPHLTLQGEVGKHLWRTRLQAAVARVSFTAASLTWISNGTDSGCRLGGAGWSSVGPRGGGDGASTTGPVFKSDQREAGGVEERRKGGQKEAEEWCCCTDLTLCRVGQKKMAIIPLPYYHYLFGGQKDKSFLTPGRVLLSQIKQHVVFFPDWELLCNNVPCFAGQTANPWNLQNTA